MIGNYSVLQLSNFKYVRLIISNTLLQIPIEKDDGVYPYAAGIDIHSWMQSIPLLVEDLKSVNLYKYWVASSLVLTYDRIVIHRDHAAEFDYSLNLPIMNTEDTYTCFYSSSVEPQTRYLPNGLPYDAYDENTCSIIDKVELVEPTLLNVKIPHGVTLGNNKIPRITIALRMSSV